ncbi:hypothetical protein FOA52_012802 [Chlamydomonas sp. UWO 241]|nr:hypothetical protein FOA52_012802 [Chlamydomonas sp. UWO 241]
MLLSSIGGLGEDRMSRVALAMADASMRHELSALATAGVTSAAGCAAPGGSLLLAAALSGDSPALGSVLQQLACAGLRAAHAKVHGLSDAPEALEKWRAELRGAAGGPGAPHLTVFN